MNKEADNSKIFAAVSKKKKRITALTCDTLNKTFLSLPVVFLLINQLFMYNGTSFVSL